MIRLFEKSGSSEITLLHQSFSKEEWEHLKGTAISLLEKKSYSDEAKLLKKYAFLLYEGTNGFKDKFHVLSLQVPMNIYIELAEMNNNWQLKWKWRNIADSIGEIVSKEIRFVIVDLSPTENIETIASPSLEITSDVVERALQDAQQLIATQGATSGVDRVHTAFHGYLKAVATCAGLSVTDSINITGLFKIIRQKHSSFKDTGPRQGDLEKIMRSIANIVDALNPVRNQASIAHPNEDLLEEPEAMLVINCVKTLLHYLNKRIRM